MLRGKIAQNNFSEKTKNGCQGHPFLMELLAGLEPATY